MSAVKNKLEEFLIAIDGLGDGTIREIVGDEYIDTPGFYSQEADDYDGIFDFMRANMGMSEFARLINWHDENPDKVNRIITAYTYRHA